MSFTGSRLLAKSSSLERDLLLHLLYICTLCHHKTKLLDLLKLRLYNPEDYNFLDLMYPRKNKSCCWRSCFDLSNFIWVENMFWDMHYETTLTLVVLRHDTCMRFASPTLMASRDLLNTLLFLQMYCSLRATLSVMLMTYLCINRI